jgi:hypothetical protein
LLATGAKWRDLSKTFWKEKKDFAYLRFHPSGRTLTGGESLSDRRSMTALFWQEIYRLSA